ncbi:MAG: hypothetical protein N3B10_10790 [Armatimonadetes bacterium]|nr:hypothetical protein [Armatimonadota bacterium]MCX7968953.1 hypothetical protein [Armatimonadota bacterium]MDW8143113.1 hypothetical protein [Armatimonadota bacterium]
MSETNFLWFLVAGVATAVVHALLPNHWLPFIAAARFHRWSSSQLFQFTLLVAIAHAAMTIGLGIAVGLLGEGVAHFFHENSARIVGFVLLVLAATFFFAPQLYGHHHIHHPECEHCRNSGQVVTLAGLFVALALSPCEGLLPVFFAVAVKFGWIKALTIAFTSSLLTVILLVAVVLLAHNGWVRVLPQLHEKHERVLASGLMLILGILMLLQIGH